MVLPSFCAANSASLFSKPAPARLENGRLLGSAQTRKVASSAAATACNVTSSSAALTRLRIAIVLGRGRTELEHEQLASTSSVERKVLRRAGKPQGCIAHAHIDFGIGDHARPAANSR